MFDNTRYCRENKSKFAHTETEVSITFLFFLSLYLLKYEGGGIFLLQCIAIKYPGFQVHFSSIKGI